MVGGVSKGKYIGWDKLGWDLDTMGIGNDGDVKE